MERPHVSELRIIGAWPGMAQYMKDDKTGLVWCWNRCSNSLSNCGEESRFREIFSTMYRGELFDSNA